MTEPIRILLADDHAVLRSGLRLLIDQQDDMQVIGEAGDGREVIRIAQKLQPDVILLDINMPHVDGLAALEPLHEVAPQARILILTMHDDGDYLRHALQAGAAGYVLKQAVDYELLLAIRAVIRGETPIHSAMTSKLFQPGGTTITDSKENPWILLSEREHDVLRLVALGYTNTEIGEELFLSVKTVETYRARGMEKLDLKTRAQLVKSALLHGILGDES